MIANITEGADSWRHRIASAEADVLCIITSDRTSQHFLQDWRWLTQYCECITGTNTAKQQTCQFSHTTLSSSIELNISQLESILGNQIGHMGVDAVCRLQTFLVYQGSSLSLSLGAGVTLNHVLWAPRRKDKSRHTDLCHQVLQCWVADLQISVRKRLQMCCFTICFQIFAFVKHVSTNFLLLVPH